MFVKWISCAVPEPYSPGFASAQSGWTAITGTAGLVGQLGGWAQSGTTALILAFWDDQPSYERFMAEEHDQVFQSTAQSATYTPIEIATGTSLLTMPGAAPSPSEAIRASQVLRVADCTVHPGSDHHLRQVQEQAPRAASDESRHSIECCEDTWTPERVLLERFTTLATHRSEQEGFLIPVRRRSKVVPQHPIAPKFG